MNLSFLIRCFLSCTWWGNLVVFWRVEVGMSRNKHHFCLICLDTWKTSWKTVYWFFLTFTFPVPDLKMLLNSSKVNCPIQLIPFHLHSYSMFSYLYFTNKIKGYDCAGNFYVQTTRIAHKKRLHVLGCGE